jgi:hypothetical protein
MQSVVVAAEASSFPSAAEVASVALAEQEVADGPADVLEGAFVRWGGEPAFEGLKLQQAAESLRDGRQALVGCGRSGWRRGRWCAERAAGCRSRGPGSSIKEVFWPS